MNGSIKRIRATAIRRWPDTGHVIAYTDWIDTRGRYGCTSGNPDSMHMQALIKRAVREGIPVKQETGCTLSPIGMRT